MRVRSIRARENPVGSLSRLRLGLETPRGFEARGVRGTGKLAATAASFAGSSSVDTTGRAEVHARESTAKQFANWYRCLPIRRRASAGHARRLPVPARL